MLISSARDAVDYKRQSIAMQFVEVGYREPRTRGRAHVSNGCRYNRVMIQSISHERGRMVMRRCQLLLLLRPRPSLRPFGNFQSPKQRERRDNCDYCEFSGARNYVNEVEERERKERVEAW